jgi:uncharacterized protein (TIGR02145 family)
MNFLTDGIGHMIDLRIKFKNPLHMKKLKNFNWVKIGKLTIFSNLLLMCYSHIVMGQVPANIGNKSIPTSPYDSRVEELKVRWKKAALENCSPCIEPTGPTAPAGCPTQSTVTSSTGRVWMDKNLGATQVATSKDDHLSYGHLFQWGRRADGHELINWTSGSAGTPQTPANFDINYNRDSVGNNIFSAGTNYPSPGRYDWRHPANITLWVGLNGTNNPCPCGFRIPTKLEWEAEMNNGGAGTWGTGSQQYLSAFNSVLKIPYAGYRKYDTGNLSSIGTEAYYQTSTTLTSGNNEESHHLLIRNSGAFSFVYTFYRNNGFSVRCIKDVGTVN